MVKKLKNPTYKKLGYSGMDTVKIVKNLNTLLANYQIHYQKLRNFHWNVKGNQFFVLHEFFEDQYTETSKNIDEIAERIRVFGETPISNLQEYLNSAEIKESTADLTGEAMMREILTDYELLLSFMINAVDAAVEIGDVSTEDMINGFVKKMEHSHMMINAWLNG
jgi:starvation-inducible DNA-binding protein